MGRLTTGRGRLIARFLASHGGMVHVAVSAHHPLMATEGVRVLFELEGPPPFQFMRVITRRHLYQQAEWLRGGRDGTVRIGIEAMGRGAIDECLVMMDLRSLSTLSTMITDGTDLSEWLKGRE